MILRSLKQVQNLLNPSVMHPSHLIQMCKVPFIICSSVLSLPFSISRWCATSGALHFLSWLMRFESRNDWRITWLQMGHKRWSPGWQLCLWLFTQPWLSPLFTLSGFVKKWKNQVYSFGQSLLCKHLKINCQVINGRRWQWWRDVSESYSWKPDIFNKLFKAKTHFFETLT